MELDLATYLKKIGRTQHDLAVALGITDAHMSRLVNGRSRASAELAQKIEAATKGTVRFKALMLAPRRAA